MTTYFIGLDEMIVPRSSRPLPRDALLAEPDFCRSVHRSRNRMTRGWE